MRSPFPGMYPYYTLISRVDRRPKCDVYAWTVREPLPVLPIPLLEPDADVRVSLATALTVAYARGRYERAIDYDDPPPGPALSAADAEWVTTLARAGAQPS